MANHHTTVFLGSLLWNGLANLSVCILSHSYFCVQDLMTLMRLHRCTFSSRPSLFVFVIITTFMSWIVGFLLGRNIWHIFQSMLRRDSVCMQSHRAFTALSHTQSVCLYGIFYQSMLKQALSCVQSHQSLHWSHTCAKWAYIRAILSVNAQTSLSVCAVLPEPLLLSHMHKNGRKYGIFCQSMLRRDLVCMQSSQSVHCSRTCAKWAYIRAYSFSKCSDEP